MASFGGATKQPASGGFTFGAPANKTATVAPFGTSTATSTPSFGGLFSSNPTSQTTTPATGSLFGSSSTPASSASTGLFTGLSKPATSTTGFSFKPATTATTSAPGFNIGGLATSIGVVAPSIYLGGSSTSQPTSSTGLFGSLSSSTTSAPSLFGGLGTTSSAGSGGLFGAKPAATTSSSFFGNLNASTQPTTSATQFKGLGGSDASATSSGSTAQGTQEPKLAKESNVPPELMQCVDALKKHITEEKKFRDEISRNSTAKPLFQIQSDISELRNETVLVFSIVQRSLNQANNIKEEFNRELRNFEMISRVRDTPIALQDSNYNPVTYFQEKTDTFFNQMVALSDQLQVVEKFLSDKRDAITAEDFIIGLQQINEVFVGLVGKYQFLQEKIAQLKSEYLHYRKIAHHDSTDIFKQLHKQSASLNLTALSPSKYPDVRSLEKGSLDSSNTASTVGPSSFTQTSSDSHPVVSGNTFGSATSSGSALGSSLFGSSSQTSGGLFGTQSTFGVSFGTSSPASKPGTKRNKSK